MKKQIDAASGYHGIQLPNIDSPPVERSCPKSLSPSRPQSLDSIRRKLMILLAHK
jgi:hypothetical protein